MLSFQQQNKLFCHQSSFCNILSIFLFSFPFFYSTIHHSLLVRSDFLQEKKLERHFQCSVRGRKGVITTSGEKKSRYVIIIFLYYIKKKFLHGRYHHYTVMCSRTGVVIESCHPAPLIASVSPLELYSPFLPLLSFFCPLEKKLITNLFRCIPSPFVRYLLCFRSRRASHNKNNNKLCFFSFVSSQ